MFVNVLFGQTHLWLFTGEANIRDLKKQSVIWRIEKFKSRPLASPLDSQRCVCSNDIAVNICYGSSIHIYI